MAKIEREIEEKNEAIALFSELERLSKAKPEVFAFFMSKYSKLILDNYDWGALWRSDETQVGILDKFLPYINIVILIIILVMEFLKYKK